MLTCKLMLQSQEESVCTVYISRRKKKKRQNLVGRRVKSTHQFFIKKTDYCNWLTAKLQVVKESRLSLNIFTISGNFLIEPNGPTCQPMIKSLDKQVAQPNTNVQYTPSLQIRFPVPKGKQQYCEISRREILTGVR